MSLTLVSSSDDRVLAIRDHLLTVVRERGRLQVQKGPLRLIVFETGPWIVNHWTPFNALSPEEASSPGYRHALERQHSRPDLPYGLDVWHGEKVLSILWSDQGRFEVTIFVRGSWEDEALKLQGGWLSAITLRPWRCDMAILEGTSMPIALDAT
jgi:hypothetical protein